MCLKSSNHAESYLHFIYSAITEFIQSFRRQSFQHPLNTPAPYGFPLCFHRWMSIPVSWHLSYNRSFWCSTFPKVPRDRIDGNYIFMTLCAWYRTISCIYPNNYFLKHINCTWTSFSLENWRQCNHIQVPATEQSDAL